MKDTKILGVEMYAYRLHNTIVKKKKYRENKSQRHRILGSQTPDIGLWEMFMANTHPHLFPTSC